MKKLLTVAALIGACYGLRWWLNRAPWHEEVDNEWQEMSKRNALYRR